MKEIYCLFGIANMYDQPDNNLICWWSTKPTIEQITKALGIDLKEAEDTAIVAVVAIYNGGSARIYETDYRIQKVKAETPLDRRPAK